MAYVVIPDDLTLTHHRKSRVILHSTLDVSLQLEPLNLLLFSWQVSLYNY